LHFTTLLTFRKTIATQAKREQAKKEGRLLTKKQKEEKAAAEIRRKALLESGVKIEGLQQQQNAQNDGPAVPKKVMYGNRKKKGPAALSKDEPGQKAEEETEAATPQTSEVVELPDAEVGSPKEDVEASEYEVDMANGKASAIKDSWDASSDEESAPENAKPNSKGRRMCTVICTKPRSLL
jgi:translation initiation factor 5B